MDGGVLMSRTTRMQKSSRQIDVVDFTVIGTGVLITYRRDTVDNTDRIEVRGNLTSADSNVAYITGASLDDFIAALDDVKAARESILSPTISGGVS